MEPVKPELTLPEGWHEVIFAEHQPQYTPLPVALRVDGRLVSRWRPTEDERKAIAEGKDVFLTVLTFNEPLQPVLLTVGGAPVVPMRAIPVRPATPEEMGPVDPPRPPDHKPVG
jgi:hypothetical protein